MNSNQQRPESPNNIPVEVANPEQPIINPTTQPEIPGPVVEPNIPQQTPEQVVASPVVMKVEQMPVEPPKNQLSEAQKNDKVSRLVDKDVKNLPEAFQLASEIYEMETD